MLVSGVGPELVPYTHIDQSIGGDSCDGAVFLEFPFGVEITNIAMLVYSAFTEEKFGAAIRERNARNQRNARNVQNNQGENGYDDNNF